MTKSPYATKYTSFERAIAQGYIPVKCSSHRARERLIGHSSNAQGYYSYRRNTNHGVYAVTPDTLPIKGVTILRGPYVDMLMCWS